MLELKLDAVWANATQRNAAQLSHYCNCTKQAVPFDSFFLWLEWRFCVIKIRRTGPGFRLGAA